MKNKIIILIISTMIVLALFYILKPATKTNTLDLNLPVTFVIVIKDGKIRSGGGNIKVNQGDRVSFRITDNRDEELHLHGYDKMVDIPANLTAQLDFVADKTGRFPFELEKEGIELGNLEVDPR